MKEKETYKKAKEILEKYGDGVDVKITPVSSPTLNNSTYYATPYSNRLASSNPSANPNFQSQLIHRTIRKPEVANPVTSHQPMKPLPSTQSSSEMPSNRNAHQAPNAKQNERAKQRSNDEMEFQRSQIVRHEQPRQINSSIISQARTQLPRPVMGPDRSLFDKMIDYLIGEGPNNR